MQNSEYILSKCDIQNGNNCDIIKIKFSGMGDKFNIYNNFIVNVLRKYYNVQFSDKPDYLFYSVYSEDYLNYDCIRIFYTAENVIPDFNLCDYAIGFHYIDFEDRYIRYPLYLVDGYSFYSEDDYPTDLERAIHKHENYQKGIMQKESFCSFVYSNAFGSQYRKMLYEKLSEYKKVNSGGSFLNNIGYIVQNKYEFQKKHKFVIAFENSDYPGYTSEKIVHAFAAGAIPIYWGDKRISDVFNEDAFINCNTYFEIHSAHEAISIIVDKIIMIDNDDELYRKMLCTPAFRNGYSIDLEKKRFEDFVLHIVKPQLQFSYRRNMKLWGERYELKTRLGNDFYAFICRSKVAVNVIKDIINMQSYVNNNSCTIERVNASKCRNLLVNVLNVSSKSIPDDYIIEYTYRILLNCADRELIRNGITPEQFKCLFDQYIENQ